MRFLCGIFLVIGLCGCGGGADSADHPDTTPVSGVVLYNGAPLEGATITFHPQDSVSGKGAFARSDAEGKFVAGTFTSDDGMIPGSYSITVAKVEYVGGSQVSEEDPNYDPNAPEAEAKSLIPEKYGNVASSEFTVDVSTTEIGDLKLELSGD